MQVSQLKTVLDDHICDDAEVFVSFGDPQNGTTYGAYTASYDSILNVLYIEYKESQ